jgi:hypothetical protein
MTSVAVFWPRLHTLFQRAEGLKGPYHFKDKDRLEHHLGKKSTSGSPRPEQPGIASLSPVNSISTKAAAMSLRDEDLLSSDSEDGDYMPNARELADDENAGVVNAGKGKSARQRPRAGGLVLDEDDEMDDIADVAGEEDWSDGDDEIAAVEPEPKKARVGSEKKSDATVKTNGKSLKVSHGRGRRAAAKVDSEALSAALDEEFGKESDQSSDEDFDPSKPKVVNRSDAESSSEEDSDDNELLPSNDADASGTGATGEDVDDDDVDNEAVPPS